MDCPCATACVRLVCTCGTLLAGVERALLRAAVRAGKAAAISISCLIFGAFVGTLLQNWLRLDIVPIGVRALPCLSAPCK